MQTLAERFPEDRLLRHARPLDQCRPFPPASDRAAWSAVAADPRHAAWIDGLRTTARAVAGAPVPPLPASLYAEYALNGNRFRYEEPCFARRAQLGVLVLAETLEFQGAFLPPILDRLWAITEEASWSVPAHAERLDGDCLPRQDRHTVDLFACETAAVLANTLLLLGPAITALSPAAADRVRIETGARIFREIETRGGHAFQRLTNNWAPWCSANILDAANLLVADPAAWTRIARITLSAVDRFLAGYGEDGACDEGPGYWSHAAGSLLDFLEALHARTGLGLEVFDEPRIRAMGLYFDRVHLAGPWFANFADGSPKPAIRRGVLCRFAERAALPSLAALALAQPVRIPQPTPHGQRTKGAFLTESLRDLFWTPPGPAPAPAPKEPCAWLADRQILVARETSDAARGWILAAKGGTNDESHNHNDLGAFIAMLHGQPLLVDAGVGDYSAKTFGPERYSIWTMQSFHHGLPEFNGVQQQAGPGFRAKAARFESGDDGVQLGLDLAAAYPSEAGLARFLRLLELRRAPASDIRVTDEFAAARPAAVRYRFYSPVPVLVKRPGAIGFEGSDAEFRFEPDLLATRLDAVTLDDTKLRLAWGGVLHAIELATRTPLASGAFAFRLVRGSG